MAARNTAIVQALLAIAALLTLFWLLPIIHPHRAHDGGFYAIARLLIAITGGIPAWLGARRLLAARRLRRIADRATASPTLTWRLAGKLVVAADDDAADPELSFAVTRALRAMLTAVPRATALPRRE